jgi:DNA-binding response OmpR family regulator
MAVTTMGLHLLVVDADDVHRAQLRSRLADEGYSVATASGVTSAVDACLRRWPHLGIVDASFTDGSAEKLAMALAQHGDLPLIVVTSVGDSAAKAQAIDRFADDYITRPYGFAELHARVRRVLNRALLASSAPEELVDLGDGRMFDPRRRWVRIADDLRRLTPTEARLLEFFVRNPNRVLPVELILQRVWLDAPVGPNVLWEYVRRLRQRLGDDSRKPRYLVSARGIGYQYYRGTKDGRQASPATAEALG